MAEMVIDRAGLVSVDRADDLLIVDGVRITMECLVSFVRLEGIIVFRFDRVGDEVRLTRITELGEPPTPTKHINPRAESGEKEAL